VHLLPSLKLTDFAGNRPCPNRKGIYLPAIDSVKNSWNGVAFFIAAWATLLASEQRRHHPTGGGGVFQVASTL